MQSVFGYFDSIPKILPVAGRTGVYDPIAASRLDHKNSLSLPSVPPW